MPDRVPGTAPGTAPGIAPGIVPEIAGAGDRGRDESGRVRWGGAGGAMLAFIAATGVFLWLVGMNFAPEGIADRAAVFRMLGTVFVGMSAMAGGAGWLISRRTATDRDAHREDARAREREARTAVAELHADKERAEFASTAKTRYLVAVSHEIRAPLNAIYGYAQLLERDGATSGAEAGAVIRRSAEHLTDLVEGLLEISRIESGVVQVRADMVALPTLLDHVADLFRVQAEDKGLGFDVIVKGRMPHHVRTDEKRLRQILINLLSNAIKYTREGTVSLFFSYRGQVADIAVADSGIGIAPEDLERIFEPFERGGSAEARSQPGVGLGLAITRVLARILGGEVFVTSTPGAGSRFCLRIFLPEPQTAPADVAVPEARRVRGYAGPRRTVLVIDDDPAQVGIVAGLLRPLGFDVFTASQGREGLALAGRCAPDLVLLDVQMPGLSGWEVAQRLRAAHDPALRIVMVSATVQEGRAGHEGQGHEGGAGDGRASHDGFVTKPVDLAVLLDMIGRQLRLAWHTEHAVPAAGPDAVPAAGGAGAAPPDAMAPFIEPLRAHIRVGHVRGIEAVLADMAAAVPDSANMVAAMRDHLHSFDLRGLGRMLDDVQPR